MKAYPEYKDSGVPWLGKVPKHWEIKRLGSKFIERREKVSDKDYPPLSVTKNGILPQLANAAKTNDGDNRKRVCLGDFVINSRSDRKGSSGLSNLDGSVSLINTVLKPRDFEQRYVHCLLKSYPFQEEFYRVGRGIVADLWSTQYSEMSTIMIPVPGRGTTPHRPLPRLQNLPDQQVHSRQEADDRAPQGTEAGYHQRRGDREDRRAHRQALSRIQG